MSASETLSAWISGFVKQGMQRDVRNIPRLLSEEITVAIEHLPFAIVPNSDGKVGIVENLTDAEDYGKNSTWFGFHADGGYLDHLPRYVLLYCVRTGGKGGRTFFARSAGVIAAMRKHFGDNLIDSTDIMYLGPTEEHRRPLVEKTDGGEILNWYTNLYLRPRLEQLNAYNRKNFTRLSGELIRFVGDRLKDDARRGNIHSWTPGDCMLFDNHQLLHGRTEIQDPVSRRLLYRIWFSPR